MKIFKKIIFRIYRKIKFHGDIYGKVGKRNKFRRGSYVNEISIIGKYNYVGENTMITNAIIGNYCSIAPGVKIGLAEHSIQFLTTFNKISSEVNKFKMYKSPAIIKNDVWIGANVIIKQGVKVGNGAVIGAGAVVTRDIPDYSIVVGIPAKVINYRFDNKKIKLINDSQWWNNDIKKAKEIISNLDKNMEDYIEKSSYFNTDGSL